MFRRLEQLVGALLTGILAFSLVALPLAMAGWFRPLPVIGGAVVLWAVLWRALGGGAVDPTAEVGSRPTIVVVVFVLMLTGLNVRYSSQHLLTERDPGVYVTTAQWLANEGTLLIDPDGAPYRGVHNEYRIQFAAAGYYEGHRDDGKLYPQFVHLLPATLGASSWVVGSRGMLKVNALLGGMALLVFFVLASKLLPPWPAVGVTAALGLNLVQIHFSRDAYTEILTQILLFGGLWILLAARRTFHIGRAVVAGLLVGAASMARVDAFIFLVPLAIYIAYELVSAPRPIDSRRRSYLRALGGGAAVPALFAWIDARLFSPVYLNDLWPSVKLVWIILVLVAIGGAVVFAVRPRVPRIAEWTRLHRKTLATLVAAGITAFAVAAFAVRPSVQTVLQEHVNRFVELLQRSEGLAVDGRRTYAEESMHWLNLYLGPVALGAGVLGMALLSRRIVLGRSKPAVPFVLAFLPMFALYVWEPSITPDHIWALRRFLPVVIPGLLLGCFWLVGRLWGDPERIRRAGAVAIAVAALAFPVWTLAPVVTERTQLGVLTVTEKFCSYVPSDAAVLVAQTQLLDQNFTQTVRTFCDVPAANAPMDQPMSWYAELSRRWAANGRVLYVVSPQSWFGTHWPAEGSTYLSSVIYRNLERTLSGRPDSLERFEWGLFVRRLDEAELRLLARA